MGSVSVSHLKFMHLSHIKTYLFHPLQHFPFPVFKIFFPILGTDKVFYFHLFKFSLPKNKISRSYFVSKSLADLRHAEGQFWMKSIDSIFKINEHGLGCFRPEIGRGSFLPCTNLSLEHYIELFAVRRGIGEP